MPRRTKHLPQASHEPGDDGINPSHPFTTGCAGGPPPRDKLGEEWEELGCRSVRPGRRTSRVAFFEEVIDPDDPLLGFAPYVHKAPRRNSITPERQRAFIAALAASGVVTQAARVIGASLEALYKLRNQPGAQGFSAAWDLAIDRGMARLEDCALERAILGEERPVVSQGKLVTTYLRHDTQLMLFLLRHRRAHRYGEDLDPVPGSPLFERVRRAIEAAEPSLDEVRAAIHAKLEDLRRTVDERRMAPGPVEPD